MSNEVKNWVSVEDAAQITGKSISTVRRWLKSVKPTPRAKQHIREVPFPDKGGYKILIMRSFLVEEFGAYNDFGSPQFMSAVQSPAISHIAQSDIYSLYAQVLSMRDELRAMHERERAKDADMHLLKSEMWALKERFTVLDVPGKKCDDMESAAFEQVPEGHCVYLLHDKGNGLTKIGFTKNFKQREKGLNNANPMAKPIGIFSGLKKDEDALHRVFRRKRVRLEWFRLNDEDVQYIHKYFDTANKSDALPGLFDLCE